MSIEGELGLTLQGRKPWNKLARHQHVLAERREECYRGRRKPCYAEPLDAIVSTAGNEYTGLRHTFTPADQPRIYACLHNEQNAQQCSDPFFPRIQCIDSAGEV